MTNQEFKQKYLKLRLAYQTSDSAKHKAVQAVQQDFHTKLSATKNELANLEKQYFIESYDNASLFLDRLTSGNQSIRLDAPYHTAAFIDKRPVIVGYYKNGNPRTRMTPFAIAQFSSDSTKINIQTGHTLTEARILIKHIETKFSEAQPFRQQLDKDIKSLQHKLSKLEQEREKAVADTIQKFDKQKLKLKSQLDNLLAHGSSEELRSLFKTSRIVLLALASLIGFFVIKSAFRGYTNLIQFISESSFTYSLETPESISADCYLRFDDADHVFRCDGMSYIGSATYTTRSELKINGTTQSIDEGGYFLRQIPELIIPADAWAVETPDFHQIAEHYGNYTDTAKIYNLFLRNVMAEQKVTVTWRFNENDFKLMEEKWSEWKIEQERIATEKLEAAKKAEEEARLHREEEERKKAEEAAAKAKAEEEAKQQQSSSSSNSSSSGSSSGNSSSSSGSSSSSSNGSSSSSSGNSSGSSSGNSSSSSSSSSGGGYPASDTDIDGICKDGFKVHGNPHAKGKANACYGHGGWINN